MTVCWQAVAVAVRSERQADNVQGGDHGQA